MIELFYIRWEANAAQRLLCSTWRSRWRAPRVIVEHHPVHEITLYTSAEGDLHVHERTPFQITTRNLAQPGRRNG
jgi:hypothetical protein